MLTLPITVHVFEEGKRAAELEAIRVLIINQGVQIMTVLADLQAKVTANGAVIGSAITLIQGLKTKLDEAIASGDPAALQALSDSLGASDQALADAITANTPSAPAAPAAPADGGTVVDNQGVPPDNAP